MLTPHDYKKQIVDARSRIPLQIRCPDSKAAVSQNLLVANFESELRLLKKHVESDIQAIDESARSGKGLVGNLVARVSARPESEQAKVDPYEALVAQIDVLLSQAETLKIQIAGYRHTGEPIDVPFRQADRPPAQPAVSPSTLAKQFTAAPVAANARGDDAPDEASPWLDRITTSAVTAAVITVGLLGWHMATYKAPADVPLPLVSQAALPVAGAQETSGDDLGTPAHDTNAISGKVVGVIDGDTIDVLDKNSQQIRVRLADIDAPEFRQAFGSRAKQSLSDKVFGQDVIIEWREKDKYGRVIGHVTVDGRNINRELIADGFAWLYTKYCKSAELAQLEKEAREAKRGLWADDAPVAPWAYRHPEAEKKTAAVTRLTAEPIRPASLAPDPAPAARAPTSNSASGEFTASGKPIYTGPRGGEFHYSDSGKKVYEKHKK